VKILHKPAQIIENQADNFLMLPQKTVRIFDNTHVGGYANGQQLLV